MDNARTGTNLGHEAGGVFGVAAAQSPAEPLTDALSILIAMLSLTLPRRRRSKDTAPDPPPFAWKSPYSPGGAWISRSIRSIRLTTAGPWAPACAVCDRACAN